MFADAVQPGADGGGGLAGHFGQLGGGVAFVVPHGKKGGVPQRQLVKDGGQLHPGHGQGGGIVGGLFAGGGGVLLQQLLLFGGPAGGVAVKVVGRLKKPGFLLGGGQGAQQPRVAHGPEKGLLGQVLGGVLVPRQPAAKAAELVPKAVIERFPQKTHLPAAARPTLLPCSRFCL